MTRYVPLAMLVLASTAGLAPAQQAGETADPEAAFQALIAQCDDTDALMLRSRLRMTLPRTTDAAAATAQQMMGEAFATCASGDIDGARAQLNAAIEVADAGATEKFQTDASPQSAAGTASSPEVADAPKEGAASSDKAWWKFW